MRQSLKRILSSRTPLPPPRGALPPLHRRAGAGVGGGGRKTEGQGTPEGAPVSHPLGAARSRPLCEAGPSPSASNSLRTLGLCTGSLTNRVESCVGSSCIALFSSPCGTSRPPPPRRGRPAHGRAGLPHLRSPGEGGGRPGHTCGRPSPRGPSGRAGHGDRSVLAGEACAQLRPRRRRLDDPHAESASSSVVHVLPPPPGSPSSSCCGAAQSWSRSAPQGSPSVAGACTAALCWGPEAARLWGKREGE